MVDFAGKKVLVAGLGKSGIASFETLKALGASVAVYDAKSASDFSPELTNLLVGADCYLGEKPPAEAVFDIVVLSPGISPERDFVRDAEKNGGEIIGELELAYRVSKGIFAAITGTNGKTTTTALTGEIFRNAAREVYVVGNIGTAVTTVCRATKEDTWLITETSSFQLETIKQFKPKISAVLNITPDHMDRHKNMANYRNAKARIFENQEPDDFFVVNFDDVGTYEMASRCNAKVVPFSRVSELEFGAFIKNNMISFRDEAGELTEFCGTTQLKIPGKHNLENALAAAAIAYVAGISAKVIRDTLTSFGGVPHRLEFCGKKAGVGFVNDSKGTNPDASIRAIEATPPPIILIAGGYDKKADFSEFVDSFGGKVKNMMLFGATAERIKEAAKSKGFNKSIILKNMEECVKHAFEAAEPGDTVLLSPACASWDMYSCFEERGEDFKACVKKLSGD